MVLVKYLHDNYFRSQAATRVDIAECRDRRSNVFDRMSFFFITFFLRRWDAKFK